MEPPQTFPKTVQGLCRRELLKASLATGATLSLWPPHHPPALWGAEAGQPKRGGILRLAGNDPVHFDPHLTISFKTHTTLSFVYSQLLRYKVGPDVPPGAFILEPDVAERWEMLDDTTYVFHLQKGVKWHNKPPVNGRELVAEDVQFTFDRFLTDQGNQLRELLEPVERVEVVDRYTVKLLLKEPFVWLLDVLARPQAMWIIAPEVVHQYGDLKLPETAIGTGPFLLERYEPNVKAVFKRHPEYFRTGLPWVDGVEWLVINDDSTRLAMYRTGQLDMLGVRQPDLDALKQSHPHYLYQDYLSNVASALFMRTDQPPFHDVRVRRAISHALDRQGLIEAVAIRGEPTPAVPRGLTEWSLPLDQLGAGARYYQYDPPEAKRLLAEAGIPQGFQTQLTATGGFGRDVLDAVQLVQRQLKDVGIEAALRRQEYGAYVATTRLGKFEGMVYAPFTLAWEPHTTLYAAYSPDQPLNAGHVNDPQLTAMLKEQQRTKALEAHKQLIFAIQRYEAEQQYYVYTYSAMNTVSWQPDVKHFAPSPTWDIGGLAAALWLER